MRTWHIPAAAALAIALSLCPGDAAAQEGGSETGDLFGDLVHIKRDATTGRPILQRREILLPQDVLGIGYCPIPVDAFGKEIPFLPQSCDPDPAYAAQIVAVDYFGRLSGGRTKERNQRMHFDEMIDNLKTAEVIDIDEAGRLKYGTTCDASGACATWKTIDSPMENLAIYRRLLKYGHIQTDPLEIDTWEHGDPALGTVYHPALGAADWPKFRGRTRVLLPRGEPSQCFSGDAFVAACAEPQSLTPEDFVLAGAFLGGASDKTGKITVDLVQYLNRLLKIPVATPESAAALDTLPALIRDEEGTITPATPDLPFPANERFLNFAAASYLRSDWFNGSYLGLQTADGGATWVPTSVNILEWLSFANGAQAPAENIAAFVAGSSDALRAVEFIHNYEVPANLWGVGTVTTTTKVKPATAQYRTAAQPITLAATILSTTAVSGGTVTFSVKTAGGVAVGSAVTSGAVVGGNASATYVLPAGTLPETLVIIAVYSGTSSSAPSSGGGSLVVAQMPTHTEMALASAPISPVAQVVALVAHVGSDDPAAIGAGTATFIVQDSAGAMVGSAVTVPVKAGAAEAGYTLPGGVSGRFTVRASYSGTTAYAASAGSNYLAVGLAPIAVASLTANIALPAQAGTPITWTAAATGGVTPYSFRFSVFDGAAWTLGRDWSESNTWTWSPAMPGQYTIRVSVRNAGSTAVDAEAAVDALITSTTDLTVTSVTPSALSVAAGTPVTWTVTATGGTPPYTYAFWVFDGETWSIAQDWGTSNQWTWTPPAAGTYMFHAWVRNAGSSAAYDAWKLFGPYTALRPESLTITAVAADREFPVVAGTPVRWTATAAGGTSPYTFKFYLFDGAAWTVGQDWSPSPTWNWVPPAGGTYHVQVWAREAGSVANYDAWRGTGELTVAEAAPLTIDDVDFDRESPVPAGTPVVCTTEASGGVGPYTYQMWAWDGTSWSLAHDWTSSNTMDWIPPAAGTYWFQVWVRNAGSTAAYDAWRSYGPVTTSAPTELSVTSLTISPGVPLVANAPAKVTATVAGGTGPYSYQFVVYSQGAWTIAHPWRESNTWLFTPTA